VPRHSFCQTKTQFVTAAKQSVIFFGKTYLPAINSSKICMQSDAFDARGTSGDPRLAVPFRVVHFTMRA
jgi:hypothetical protein